MGAIDQIVVSGSLLIALPLALLAGLVSFASPCVLPLIPGYLGYVGGLSDTGGRADRRRLLLGVLLFILGFSSIFVMLGLLFGAAGLLLVPWMDLITRIAGAIIILMGLVFIGMFTSMQRMIKPRWKVPRSPPRCPPSSGCCPIRITRATSSSEALAMTASTNHS